MPMTDTVLFNKSGHVARIVLNNVERHNSLGAEELAAIQEHVDSVTADGEVRVLVITGAGEKTFCAGAALHQLGSGQISGMRGDVQVAIWVSLREVLKAGITVLRSTNGVVLTAGVGGVLPTKFFTRATWLGTGKAVIFMPGKDLTQTAAINCPELRQALQVASQELEAGGKAAGKGKRKRRRGWRRRSRSRTREMEEEEEVEEVEQDGQTDRDIDRQTVCLSVAIVFYLFFYRDFVPLYRFS